MNVPSFYNYMIELNTETKLFKKKQIKASSTLVSNQTDAFAKPKMKSELQTHNTQKKNCTASIAGLRI